MTRPKVKLRPREAVTPTAVVGFALAAVMAVLVLFSAVGYWNMWYEPMIYLTKRSQYPIQSVLREILIDSNAQMMAGAGKVQIKMDTSKNRAVQTLVKYANIVVPEGGKNLVALDMIMQRIANHIAEN